MMDKIKKLLIFAGIAIVIWAVVDPTSAAEFVQFLWLKLQEAVVSLISFLKSVFNQ